MSEVKEVDVSGAEKVLPGVEVSFGSPPEKHTLIFTLKSLMTLHKLTGKNPLTGSLFEDVGPDTIATILWAGLLHEKNGLDVEALADKILFSDMAAVTDAIRLAYTNATPNPVEEKKTELSSSES